MTSWNRAVGADCRRCSGGRSEVSPCWWASRCWQDSPRIRGRGSADQQQPQAAAASRSLPLPRAAFDRGCSRPDPVQRRVRYADRPGSELGVQVTNLSAAGITLSRVEAILPLGGLRAISQQGGPCGALPAARDLVGNSLAPGASTWFTMTFKVLMKCPGPLPVQFTVDYASSGQPAAASLPGFPDLSQVPYTGCPASQPAAAWARMLRRSQSSVALVSDTTYLDLQPGMMKGERDGGQVHGADDARVYEGGDRRRAARRAARGGGTGGAVRRRDHDAARARRWRACTVRRHDPGGRRGSRDRKPERRTPPAQAGHPTRLPGHAAGPGASTTTTDGQLASPPRARGHRPQRQEPRRGGREPVR